MNHASYSWDADNLVKSWAATYTMLSNWWNDSAEATAASVAKTVSAGVKEAHAAENADAPTPSAQEATSTYEEQNSLLKELYRMISSIREVPAPHYMYRGWTEAR